jgi:hypothetical protein
VGICAAAVRKAKARQARESWKEWGGIDKRRAKGGEGDERVRPERQVEVVPIGKRRARGGEGEERAGAESHVEVVPMREGGGG